MPVLPAIQKAALRRAVTGGGKAWTVLAVTAVGLRLLQRLARDEPEVAYCEELGPGEALLISHRDEPRG